VRAAIDWVRANRTGNTLDGATIKEMIEEGRRF